MFGSELGRFLMGLGALCVFAGAVIGVGLWQLALWVSAHFYFIWL